MSDVPTDGREQTMGDVRKPYAHGSSTVMSLSADMKEALDLGENTHVSVEVNENSIVVRPLRIGKIETTG